MKASAEDLRSQRKRLGPWTSGRERSHRLSLAKRGHYRAKPSTIQAQTVIELVRDARAAGARVILHTPPVTSIYREVLAASNATFLCRLRRRLTRELDVEWYFFYEAAGFQRRHFSDWVHLNPAGSRRYVERLFSAVRARERQEVPSCGAAAPALKGI